MCLFGSFAYNYMCLTSFQQILTDNYISAIIIFIMISVMQTESMALNISELCTQESNSGFRDGYD